MTIANDLAPAPAADHSSCEWCDGLRRGLLMGLALLALVLPPVLHHSAAALPAPVLAGAIAAPAPRASGVADFGADTPSPAARQVADWVAASGDNVGTPFVIVDKKNAHVFVFDSGARLRSSTPVLLGAAAGDDTVAGIGARAIADVQPHERTTPAGRFVAERGRNVLGEDVVWVDYDAAVSMHRVRTTHAQERRLERLATPSVDDNRISYGCINVPVAFFEQYIQPVFASQRAVVYVLPERKTVEQVFAALQVAALQAPDSRKRIL